MNEEEYNKLISEVKEWEMKKRSWRDITHATYIHLYYDSPFLVKVNTGKYEGSVMRLKAFTTIEHNAKYSKKAGMVHAAVDEKIGSRGKCYFVSYKRFDLTNETKTKLVSSDIENKVVCLDFFDRDIVAGDYVFGMHDNMMSFGVVKEVGSLNNQTKILVSFIRGRWRSTKYKNETGSYAKLKRLDANETMKKWVDPSFFVKLDPVDFLQYDMI